MQSIKVHELALPTCVLLLSKNFDPSLFFNVAPYLSMSMSNLYFFVSISPKAFISYLSPCTISISKLSYLCTISPPLSSISIKGVHIIDANVCIWGRWLRLESCIFYRHHLIVGMTPLVTCTTCILCRASCDTTHRIFDLDINLCDTSPYVIAWVIHLIHLSSCR